MHLASRFQVPRRGPISSTILEVAPPSHYKDGLWGLEAMGTQPADMTGKEY